MSDPFKETWQEDYQREVEEMISALRSDQGLPSPPPAFFAEPVAASAQSILDFKTSQERLAVSEEELVRRSSQLQEEIRRREGLKELIVKQNLKIRGLEAAFEESKKELLEARRVIEDSEEKLRLGAQNAKDFQALREEEKVLLHQWIAKAKGFQAQIHELQGELEQKDQAVKAAQARHDAALAGLREQTSEREREARELARKLEEKQAALSALNERFSLKDAEAAAERQERARQAGEISQLQRELAQAQLNAKAEAQARAEEKVRVEAEIEKRRELEYKMREAAQAFEFERAATLTKIQSLQAERENLRVQVEEALAKAEAARTRALSSEEEARRWEDENRERYLSQIKTVQEERVQGSSEVHSAMEKAEAVRREGAAALLKAEEAQSALQISKARWQAEAAAALEAARRLETETAAREAEMVKAFNSEKRRLENLLAEEKARLEAAALEKARGLESQAASREAELIKGFNAEKERLETAVRSALEKAESLKAENAVAQEKARKLEAETAVREAEMLIAANLEKTNLQKSFEEENERLKAELSTALAAPSGPPPEIKELEQALEEARRSNGELSAALEAKKKQAASWKEQFEAAQVVPAAPLVEAAPVLEEKSQAPAGDQKILQAQEEKRLREAAELAQWQAKYALKEEDLPAAEPAKAKEQAPLSRMRALKAALLENRHRLIVPGAVIIAALIGAIFTGQKKPTSYAVPFSHANALVWKGDMLWVSDWYEQALFQMKVEKGAFTVVKKYPLPGSHISGMAIVDDSIILADSSKHEIQRRRLDDSLSVEYALPSPGSKPGALYYDGKFLWSSDGGGQIYQHAPDLLLTIANTYSIPFAAVSISEDKGAIWVADAASKLFYALNKDQKLAATAAYGFKGLDESKTPLSCFAWRDGKLWVGRDGAKDLLELSAGQLDSRKLPSP